MFNFSVNSFCFLSYFLPVLWLLIFNTSVGRVFVCGIWCPFSLRSTPARMTLKVPYSTTAKAQAFPFCLEPLPNMWVHPFFEIVRLLYPVMVSNWPVRSLKPSIWEWTVMCVMNHLSFSEIFTMSLAYEQFHEFNFSSLRSCNYDAFPIFTDQFFVQMWMFFKD